MKNKETKIGQGDKITETIDTDTSLLGEGNFLIIYQFVTDDEVILMDGGRNLNLSDHAYNLKFSVPTVEALSLKQMMPIRKDKP